MGYFTFTKRIACRACGSVFTITSAASKFCKGSDCVRKRRKADRLALKEARARCHPSVKHGSAAHLASALKSGDSKRTR